MKAQAHAGGKKKKPLTEGQRMAAKRRGGKQSRKNQGGRTGLEFVAKYNLRTIEGDEFTRRYG